jgi:hypothetical protein
LITLSTPLKRAMRDLITILPICCDREAWFHEKA